LLNLNSISKIILLIIGFFLEMIVIILIREYNKEVLYLIEQLEDNK